jgi:hypothetical protein
MRSLGIAIFIGGVLAALLGTGEVLSRWHLAPGAAPGRFASGEAVAIAQPFYSFDPSDDRALAAYATDIFVGRVLGQRGAIGAPTSAPGQEVPQTQYTVEVVETIKGDAAGVVTVNQVGGVDAHSGQPMMLAGDAPLRPGTSEVFLTVGVPEREWHQIVAAGYGHLAADDPARREALVARFRQAVDATSVGVAAHGRVSSVTSSQADPASIDFITFNGTVYLSTVYLAEDSLATPYTPIGPRALGPVVGEVVTNWVDGDDALAYPNEPCSWESPDGTAPRLSPGDQIYAVRGYATTFRLAARHDDGFVSYQAWCNEDAEVGADLFDIYDRVDRISVTEDLSESSGWAVIDDPATVAGLVGMLLEGAVIPEEFASTAPITHQTIVHLDDGTTFRASAAPGEFLWGLGAVAVPAEFTETLHSAWQTQLNTGLSATPDGNDG